ncbi:hypothetical protein MNL09_02825 [Bartonella krasnovii]|nr:hypothetical protein MNL09_02825 [Bartonella krasnovii]
MGYDDELAGILAAGPIDYWMGDKDAVKKYNEVTKRWRDYQRAANRDHFMHLLREFSGCCGTRSCFCALSSCGRGCCGGGCSCGSGADVVLGGRAGVAGAQITSKALAAGERAVQSALAGEQNEQRQGRQVKRR